MPQIEIDFDVFKALTNLRPSEDVSNNDVLRQLLKLPAVVKPPMQSNLQNRAGRPWLVSGTSFPEGSEFVVEHKGKQRSGVVKNGKLVLDDGFAFTTPSAAAVHVTGKNVNGWRFWKCKLPNATQYALIEQLRGKTH